MVLQVKKMILLLTFTIFIDLVYSSNDDLKVSDETKALLDFECYGTVINNGNVEFGDMINYSLSLKHHALSKLDAVELEMLILFPPYVKYLSLQDKVNDVTEEIQTIQRILFKIKSLLLQSSVNLSFSVNISDQSLKPGIHHVVTPVRINYKSILVSSEITEDITEVTFVHDVPIVIKGCDAPLGMTDKSIKFYQLSSSSAHIDLKPDRARIGAEGDAWCATEENDKQYIQVVFATTSRVSSISTWGRKEKDSWVKKYKLGYSTDGNEWFDYTESGFPKEFVGNADRYNEVRHWLINTVEANYIRIYPLEWSLGVCMRFELYGCAISKYRNCIDPLGMESGRIPSISLSHSVTDSLSLPDNSRLNKVLDYPFGWLASSATEDWLQIDLGSQHKLTSIAIQGGYGEMLSIFYVTSFKLRYSNNSLNWNKIMDGDNEKIFIGPSDPYGALVPYLIQLSNKIEGRYFRIVPDQFVNMKVMRTELYGCMIEKDYKYKETPVELSRRSVLIDQDKNYIFVCVYMDSRDVSSCKKSLNGNHWKALPTHVVSIISQDNHNGKLYGINRDMNVICSNDYGDNWYSISQKEWRYKLRYSNIQNSTHIDDILSTVEPDQHLTWLTTGKGWGVSGQGIHIKQSLNEDWVLSASWKCCGL